MNRTELADYITKRLDLLFSEKIEEFCQYGRINSFIVDDVLPESLALQIYNAFPKKEEMIRKRSLRENKYVAAQMNLYNPILEEAIYAFQDLRVVSRLSEITGIKDLIADKYLYAGGISLMDKDCFLNPHIDNSHDKDRSNYRVLNLLYYVTPNWKLEYGGNLELWDNGLKGKPRTIWSKFNRLVVMITTRSSFHSVSPIRHEGQRCCLSNYYFSPTSIDGEEYFHITAFRGRPEQKLRDILLRGDIALRSAIRKLVPKGILPLSHVYKK
ncbi:2OG-Fe(II) oxygenase [Hydrococcus rivularis NIES-593]|uniref:2OG-Fe(II) oxygenase n=1 Tax=Hydrococcus rivularis NIES-593 TaxID=1921803 RepID=A0A1U7HJL7_9CYAN|nr:2OG-Fe(II) oxygenase [Hydrococcus rivularis]OKH23782.1 2OG-Fe(II) oxygenase [Hydrococcus rivularis NIES-593]